MIPAPIVLITGVATFLGLFVLGTWLLSVDSMAWKREQWRVRCPRDRQTADVEVFTSPVDRLEFLVTREPECQSQVTKCSRFGDGKVGCSQRCIRGGAHSAL